MISNEIVLSSDRLFVTWVKRKAEQSSSFGFRARVKAI